MIVVLVEIVKSRSTCAEKIKQLFKHKKKSSPDGFAGKIDWAFLEVRVDFDKLNNSFEERELIL